MIYTRTAKDIREAARTISQAFEWKTSEEGINYWAAVKDALDKHADAAGQKAACREEIKELRRRIDELEARCE